MAVSRRDATGSIMPCRFLPILTSTIPVVGSLFLFCCTDYAVVSPPAPIDQPPVIIYFTESPPVLAQGDSVKFKFKVTDDILIDSLVLIPGDGSRQKWTPHAAVYEDSTKHQFNTSGRDSSTLYTYDNGRHMTSGSVYFFVQGNAPPVVKTDTLKGFQGEMSTVALKNIVSDPDNDPVTVQVISVSSGLDAHVDNDSLRYGMTNPAASGNASFTLQASDNHSHTVTAVIPVNIITADKITYGPEGGSFRVHDILEGSYISTVNPSLVMPGPFAGYVKIDGVVASVGGDGKGSFPQQFRHQSHTIEWFIYSTSNTLDSSLIARDNITPGDYSSLDLGVHTNAGTGPSPIDPPKPRWVVLTFYKQPMQDDPAPDFIIRGFNSKEHAGDELDYLAGRDYALNGLLFPGLTSEMQDTIKATADQMIYPLFESGKRPRMVKAGVNDTIPFRTTNVQGTVVTIPMKYASVVFRDPTGQDGTLRLANPVNPDEYESAIITYGYHPDAYPGGFQLSARLQELLARYCGPGDVVLQQMQYGTCLHEFERTSFLTGADMKLNELPKIYLSGTIVTKFFGL